MKNNLTQPPVSLNELSNGSITTQPPLCRCSCCKYEWPWGTDGNHSCTLRLMDRRTELERELETLRQQNRNLVQCVNLANEAIGSIGCVLTLVGENLKPQGEWTNENECAAAEQQATNDSMAFFDLAKAVLKPIQPPATAGAAVPGPAQGSAGAPGTPCDSTGVDQDGL